ncbi:MAG: hydroxysqualene dehydroxylase HpnE [Rhodospirillaceae bacterium]
MSGVVHVIGAGLAGLSCAVDLRRRGSAVSLHEAAPHAGGRCRSFFDRRLDRIIDNGSHLLLSANRSVLDYAQHIGGAGALVEVAAEFPFIDIADGTRWTVRPGAGRVPWWLLLPGRRVPKTGLGDYLALLTPKAPTPSQTVAARWGQSPLYRRLIEPLSTAILNTAPEDASAALLRNVLSETLGRGAARCRPILAPAGLGAALVDPAIAWLRRHGASVHMGNPLTRIKTHRGRVTALEFQQRLHPLGQEDAVVLALPPAVAHRLLPAIVPPLTTQPIVNAHYAIDLPDAPPLLGIVGGLAQWVFTRPGVMSVTVSQPGQSIETPADLLARTLWRDVCVALALGEKEMPPCRIIKERRATLAHSPDQEAARPGPRTPFANLWLAGDWTDTGLPCTLEGAVQSGRRAAALAAGA